MVEQLNDVVSRCVNIDWLEVYVLEDNKRTPCNAEYFRSQGYFVTERLYGTRQYKEMFTIQDKYGEPMLEVRRNPFAGESEFSGLDVRSSHIRFVNRYCYFDHAVRIMAEFLIKHDYEFQRIYRIDVCYDFRAFDFGDNPERFLRRYTEKKFSKVNQTKVKVFGDDGWTSIKWESVSWGSRTSMVGTKMYNKTKELEASGYNKPWIVQQWFDCGLIDRFTDLPDVWRIEFSMHSSARNWIVIEDADSKHNKKRAVPHTLEMFDGRDRLWERFEEMAHHYFQFRYVEYLDKVNSDGERNLKRKDVCREKRLFNYNLDRTFYKIEGVAVECKPDKDDDILRRRLTLYREKHADPDLRRAIDILLNNLNRERLRQITAHGYAAEIDQIRLAIATRTGWDYQTVIEKAEEIHKLLKQGEIW